MRELRDMESAKPGIPLSRVRPGGCAVDARGSGSCAGVLAGAFVLILAVLGTRPRYPADWLLENVLVFVAAPLLIWGYVRNRFSDAAYTRLFLFLVLHEIGAHYTYSEVPYDEWARSLTGASIDQVFGWQRNHYDRFVHLLYGFLVFPVAWELHDELLKRAGAWSGVLSFCFVLSLSAAYELVEAAAAFLFAGDLGMAYLGTQGDVWDAHKDMAAAAIGAVTALCWHLARAAVAPRVRGARAASEGRSLRSRTSP
jgi:putative membrane protein